MHDPLDSTRTRRSLGITMLWIIAILVVAAIVVIAMLGERARHELPSGSAPAPAHTATDDSDRMG